MMAREPSAIQVWHRTRVKSASLKMDAVQTQVNTGMCHAGNNTPYMHIHTIGQKKINGRLKNTHAETEPFAT